MLTGCSLVCFSSGVRVPFPSFRCCSWKVSSWRLESSLSITPVITGLLELSSIVDSTSMTLTALPFNLKFGFDRTVLSAESLRSIESCCSVDELESGNNSSLLAPSEVEICWHRDRRKSSINCIDSLIHSGCKVMNNPRKKGAHKRIFSGGDRTFSIQITWRKICKFMSR